MDAIKKLFFFLTFSFLFSNLIWAGTKIETSKLVISNDFTVVSNTILNSVTLAGGMDASNQTISNATFEGNGAGVSNVNAITLDGKASDVFPTLSGENIFGATLHIHEGLHDIENYEFIGSLLHIFGTNTYDGDGSIQYAASVVIDGHSNIDKNLIFANDGVPQWAWQTYRDEDGDFIYLYSLVSRKPRHL